jgi:hypothetical protein
MDLDTITLDKGSHQSKDEGGCILEWVSYLAGEPWSDTPECVSPVIRQFCITWNDQLPDADRTRLLRPFLLKVQGTNTGPEDDEKRAWVACDWLVREFTPGWLRRAGLNDDAAVLAALPELTSTELCDAALPSIRKAQKKADAARDAAGAAAGAAARDAAGAAAWDAARDALQDTVTELQVSACGLLDRMCEVGRG